MSTHVDYSPRVVNAIYAYDVDAGRHSRDSCGVKTLADRMLWVLQNRRELVKNKTTWPLMAGLKRGAVSAVIARNGTMRTDNAVALARAAHVSVAWFVSNDGDPDAPDVEPEGVDPYPSRSLAIGRAKNLGASPSALRAARQLKGERFRFMEPAAWSELILALSLNETRRNPLEAQQIIRTFLEQQKNPPEPPPKHEKKEAPHKTMRRAG